MKLVYLLRNRQKYPRKTKSHKFGVYLNQWIIAHYLMTGELFQVRPAQWIDFYSHILNENETLMFFQMESNFLLLRMTTISFQLNIECTQLAPC